MANTPIRRSARHARHRVGHVQPDALLADNHRPYARDCGRLEDVIYRIAENNLHAFTLEYFGDRFAHLHDHLPGKLYT